MALVLHEGLAVLPPDHLDVARHALGLQNLHELPDPPQLGVERGRRLALGGQRASPRDGQIGHFAVGGRRRGAPHAGAAIGASHQSGWGKVWRRHAMAQDDPGRNENTQEASHCWCL